MTGLNHALFGSLLAKILPLPLAIPLSFVSHFALDALPHFGIPGVSRETAKSWGIVLVVDAALTTTFLVYIVSYYRWDMFICAVIAMSPDIVWFKKMIDTRSFNFLRDSNWLTRFHCRIQRYERPWGLWIEGPLAILFIGIVITLW